MPAVYLATRRTRRKRRGRLEGLARLGIRGALADRSLLHSIDLIPGLAGDSSGEQSPPMASARPSPRMVDTSPSPLISALPTEVVVTDDQGRIIEANPAAERLLAVAGGNWWGRRHPRSSIPTGAWVCGGDHRTV